MLNHLNGLATRMGGYNKLIDSWLTARRQLLVTYYQVAGIKPGKPTLDDKVLNAFCQNLVDYLSSGHFSLYQRVLAKISNDNPLNVAIQLYPSLQINTERLMALYDTHLENAINDNSLIELQLALSKIGETLEARFTLEDTLIQLAFDHHVPAGHTADAGEINSPA
ncbi:sigma D regulator [Enterobacteriaceae bacterium LUAb1]